MRRMSAQELTNWQAFYELEQEATKEATDNAIAEAKAEAGQS